MPIIWLKGMSGVAIVPHGIKMRQIRQADGMLLNVCEAYQQLPCCNACGPDSGAKVLPVGIFQSDTSPCRRKKPSVCSACCPSTEISKNSGHSLSPGITTSLNFSHCFRSDEENSA